MKFRVILHRIVSWWLAFFSLATIITGYAVARRWFETQEIITDIHIIFKWSYIVLLLFHVIYTLIFVNFKGVIWRNPKKHWIRITQQITKWLILAFSLVIIITGFSHYDWTHPSLPGWLMERVHITLDIGLILSIILHLMASFKIMFTRKKIDKIWVNIAIVVVGTILIIGAIAMEILYVV